MEVFRSGNNPTHPDIRIMNPLVAISGRSGDSHHCKLYLTIIVRFMRWVEAIPMRDITAQCWGSFFREWILWFGFPTVMILYNHGPGVIPNIIRKLHIICSLMECGHGEFAASFADQVHGFGGVAPATEGRWEIEASCAISSWWRFWFPLQLPYQSPYEALGYGEHSFRLDVGGKPKTVLITRLKLSLEELLPLRQRVMVQG